MLMEASSAASGFLMVQAMVQAVSLGSVGDEAVAFETQVISEGRVRDAGSADAQASIVVLPLMDRREVIRRLGFRNHLVPQAGSAPQPFAPALELKTPSTRPNPAPKPKGPFLYPTV